MRITAAAARDVLSMMYGPPLSVISSCLRGFLVAAPGKKLVVADYNAIEARVLLHVAEGDLSIFEGDGRVYERMASMMFGVSVDAVTADQRQLAKVAVLACGYQGGIGAFHAMARAYGVHVTDAKAKEIVELYRLANPQVKAFWKAIERAAIKACKNPATVVECGPYLKFKKVGSHLLMRLPSGRAICYPFAEVHPKVVKMPDREPWETQELTYRTYEMGQWRRVSTYGGCLTENCVQGISRDLLVGAMLRLEKLGWPVVLHVHDEIGVEVPVDSGVSVKDVEDVMAEVPLWAPGLPLVVKGWEGLRYGK